MGAQWIHGQIANVAFKLAKEADLVDSTMTEDDYIEKFLMDGEQAFVKGTKVEKFWELVEILEDSTDDYNAPPGQSYGKYMDDAKFHDFGSK